MMVWPGIREISLPNAKFCVDVADRPVLVGYGNS